jgi:hypothetical protein
MFRKISSENDEDAVLINALGMLAPSADKSNRGGSLESARKAAARVYNGARFHQEDARVQRESVRFIGSLYRFALTDRHAQEGFIHR